MDFCNFRVTIVAEEIFFRRVIPCYCIVNRIIINRISLAFVVTL